MVTLPVVGAGTFVCAKVTETTTTARSDFSFHTSLCVPLIRQVDDGSSAFAREFGDEKQGRAIDGNETRAAAPPPSCAASDLVRGSGRSMSAWRKECESNPDLSTVMQGSWTSRFREARQNRGRGRFCKLALETRQSQMSHETAADGRESRRFERWGDPHGQGAQAQLDPSKPSRRPAGSKESRRRTAALHPRRGPSRVATAGFPAGPCPGRTGHFTATNSTPMLLSEA